MIEHDQVTDTDDEHDERAVLTADAILISHNHEGQRCILLVQRKYPPHQGHWALPGGKLKHGESEFNACARECYEETGVHARNLAWTPGTTPIPAVTHAAGT